MLDVVVFVRVRIDNLNEFSKFKVSTNKMLLKMKRLRKNKINIKNDILMFSVLIFFSENTMLLLMTTLGLTNLYISVKRALIRI